MLFIILLLRSTETILRDFSLDVFVIQMKRISHGINCDITLANAVVKQTLYYESYNGSDALKYCAKDIEFCMKDTLDAGSIP